MSTSKNRIDGNKLPTGYKLHNYRILGVLGEGGFGITYLAEDEMLHQRVAIKEYFPATLAARDATTAQLHTSGGDAGKFFKWGLDRFISEARIMAKVDHPNIVRVINFATLNNTGYMVMPYETGQPLDQWVNQFADQRVPPEQVSALLDAITRALGVIHDMSLIHRDVKPSNIFIRESGSPVLLDFGAARSTVGAASKTVAAIVSTGYSPIEQYSDLSEQGPWTDIYSTAAVAYRLITGRVPPDAPSRISATAAGEQDRCEKLVDMTLPGYAPAFLSAIDEGLQVRPRSRPQSIKAWRKLLGFPEVKDAREDLRQPSAKPHAPDAAIANSSFTGLGGVLKGLPLDRTTLTTAAGVAVTGLIVVLILAQPWRSNAPAPEAEGGSPVASMERIVGRPTGGGVGSDSGNDARSETPEASVGGGGETAQGSEDGKADAAEVPSKGDAPASEEKQARLQPLEPDTPAVSRQPPQPSSGELMSQRKKGLEQLLSSSLLWTILRMEYSEWYGARLDDAVTDERFQPTRRDMTQRYLDDLKDLRKAEAEHALLAPSEFKQIASLYAWNLHILKEHSVTACYDGIQHGDGTRYLSELLTHSDAPFETLLGMVFRAASIGRKLPNDVGPPRRSDYAKLTAKLNQFGWKQRDLDVIARDNWTETVSPARACKLVGEWFRAHLAIEDEAAQSRLLKESLRPIIAE